MVNCKQFRSQWSRYSLNELEPADSSSARQHLSVCRRCQAYDRQMQIVVDSLKDLSRSGQDDQESGQAELLLQRAYHRYHIATRSRQAIAATLLTGFILGAAFWATTDRVEDAAPYLAITHTQTISLPRTGVKKISLAVDSDRTFSEVTFTIELPEGVELDGYPGQNRLIWQGQLQAGKNRLTLPLLTHHLIREGVLKARIEYAGGGRELKLPLEPRDSSAALPGSSFMFIDVRKPG